MTFSHRYIDTTLNFHLFCRSDILRCAAYLCCVYDRVRSSENKGKCNISKLFSFQKAQNKWKLSVLGTQLNSPHKPFLSKDQLNFYSSPYQFHQDFVSSVIIPFECCYKSENFKLQYTL